MNKNIIFAISGFIGGLITGYFIGQTLSEKKHETEKNEDPYYVHLEYYDNQQSENPYEPTPEDLPDEVKAKEEKKYIDYTAYAKKVQEEKYAAESEFPVDENEPTEIKDDPHEGFYETEEENEDRIAKELAEEAKKFKEKHAGTIELLSKDSWDSDFPEEDYDKLELWYFPDYEELCDESGSLLIPIYKYVGDCFRKVGFDRNDDEEIYIRNHIMEENYKIHKERDISREEYFGY